MRRVLAELVRLEELLHRPGPDLTRADFAAIVDADFWEVGASGRQFGREEVLDLLVRRAASPREQRWETGEYRCRELAPDLYALSYRIDEGDRTTRRTSIWVHTVDGWKIRFHQGTVVVHVPPIGRLGVP